MRQAVEVGEVEDDYQRWTDLADQRRGLEKVFVGQNRYGSELPDSELALSAEVVDAEVVGSSEENLDIVWDPERGGTRVS